MLMEARPNFLFCRFAIIAHKVRNSFIGCAAKIHAAILNCRNSLKYCKCFQFIAQGVYGILTRCPAYMCGATSIIW